MGLFRWIDEAHLDIPFHDLNASYFLVAQQGLELGHMHPRRQRGVLQGKLLD